MANTDTQMEMPRQRGESAEQDQLPSMTERAVAGASALGHQRMHKAREQFDERLSAQRTHLSGRVRKLGRALKGAGSMLEEEELVAQCLHFASGKVDGIAGYVDEATAERVADDLRGVAHERPAWFFGSAFLLGLALGRFALSTGGASELSGSQLKVPDTVSNSRVGASKRS